MFSDGILVNIIGILDEDMTIRIPFVPQVGSYFTYLDNTYTVSNIEINCDTGVTEVCLSSL